MDIEIDGFDEVIDELEDLADRAESLDGEHEVPLGELMPTSFMRRYTDFDSLEAFVKASPWTVESREDFETIPEDKFNKYVNEHTAFSSWEAMIGKATEKWTASQLGF